MTADSFARWINCDRWIRPQHSNWSVTTSKFSSRRRKAVDSLRTMETPGDRWRRATPRKNSPPQQPPKSERCVTQWPMSTTNIPLKQSLKERRTPCFTVSLQNVSNPTQRKEINCESWKNIYIMNIDYVEKMAYSFVKEKFNSAELNVAGLNKWIDPCTSNPTF